MKTLKITMLVLLAVAFFVSCEKTKVEEPDNKEVLKSTISAKWEVGESDQYDSFEFNEDGNYIVVQKSLKKSTIDPIVIFGNYTIVNDSTLELSDFGTITISNLSDESITISIQLEGQGNSTISVSANKSEQMEASKNTDLISRSWKMIMNTNLSDYKVDTLDYSAIDTLNYPATVFFSRSNTYFINHKLSESSDVDISEMGDYSGISNWKWKNEEQTEFYYSWTTPATWSDSAYVVIDKLTPDSLILHEEVRIDQDRLVQVKYWLVPVDYTEVIPTTVSKKSIQVLPKGLFRK